jgi:cation transport ATPase
MIGKEERELNQNQSAEYRKQKHSFQRFAITSLVIGISMIVVMLAMFAMEYAYFWTMMGGPYFPGWLYFFVFCINCAGFISGIIGLKSGKKNMAITGITLCSLIFIPYIYIAYVFLIMPWL